jgi:transposase
MGYGRLLGRIPGRSGLADAIRYTLSRSPALRHFLDDGRIELDNNSRRTRDPTVALGRKNHLFAGSDGGADKDDGARTQICASASA